MHIDRQTIIKKIEDGSYFTDAREWYQQTVLFPVTQRSFLLVIAVIAFLSAIIASYTLRDMFPVTKRIPFFVYAENSADYYSRINSLAEKGGSPQEAITSYLITDFIEARESYVPTLTSSDIEWRKVKIRRISDKPVYNEYARLMHKANRASPFHKYRNHTSRLIQINEIEYDGDDPGSGKATVYFTATETTKGKSISSSWEATLHFRLPNIEDVDTKGERLNFRVLLYKTKQNKEAT